MSDVQRLLITYKNEREADEFHLLICFRCNHIETRGMTSFYTVMEEDLAEVLRYARTFGVTVQRINGADSDETYEVLHQGKAAPWAPRKAVKR